MYDELKKAAVIGLLSISMSSFAHNVAHKKQSSLETKKTQSKQKKWLAGDHHIHSRHSVKWDRSVNPPTPIMAGDAHYSSALNAQMAYHHGLDWMVITDHGGPNHSKLNLESAYPDLVASRKAVPHVIQFYGMEFDTPGARHSSLIMPHTHDESMQLYHLEKSYARNEVYPPDPARDTEERMLEALTAMDALEHKPILIANHPGRTATDLGEYTKVTPTELRNWNNTAPDVAIGMEGSPGHQANALNPDGSLKPTGLRGGYDAFPTMGGFDQMTAKLGGFWDSMLGEGRRWWITSTSDSHVHYTEGRTDFWPGEYAKTYVYSDKNYDDILHNLRQGHVFVSTGGLITELYVSARVENKELKADIGGTLVINKNDTVIIDVKFLDPDTTNAHFDNPIVKRVDIIAGNIEGVLKDKSVDVNPSTAVAARYFNDDWSHKDGYSLVSYTLPDVKQSQYIRVRGTNTEELEPNVDVAGENPWADLWFYSNPIFIQINE